MKKSQQQHANDYNHEYSNREAEQRLIDLCAKYGIAEMTPLMPTYYNDAYNFYRSTRADEACIDADDDEEHDNNVVVTVDEQDDADSHAEQETYDYDDDDDPLHGYTQDEADAFASMLADELDEYYYPRSKFYRDQHR